MRVLLLLLALLCPVLARAADTGDIGYTQQIGAQVPMDAVLHDETGAPVRLGAVTGGRPVVMALVYFHCPNLCGVILADLMDALDRTGLAMPGAYSMVALSIDPTEGVADAADAKLRHLAAAPAPGAAQGRHFLTGDRTTLQAVENAVGFHARFDAASKQFWHPAGAVVLTPDGHVAQYLLGVGYRPPDLRGALLHAQADRLAEPASPVLLLCFHYDPATGRYTLAVTRLVQGAGLLSVMAIGLFIAWGQIGRRRGV